MHRICTLKHDWAQRGLAMRGGRAVCNIYVASILGAAGLSFLSYGPAWFSPTQVAAPFS